MYTLETDFYFLGERIYVHGPTILGGFLTAIDRLREPVHIEAEAQILTCRIRQYIRENGTIFCWTVEEEAPKLNASHLCATATVQSHNQAHYFALLTQGVRPIDRCLPYDEDKYLGQVVSDYQFGGAGSLRNIATKKDLIRAIVAFNKRIHVETECCKADGMSYRWIVSSLDGLVLPSLPAEIPVGNIIMDASLRLTSLNVRNVGDNLHSVSEGYLQLAQHAPCRFQIGFARQTR